MLDSLNTQSKKEPAMKFTTALKASSMLLTVILLVLFVLTHWAFQQSKDRMACYQQAKTSDECSQPGALEAMIRAVLAPGQGE